MPATQTAYRTTFGLATQFSQLILPQKTLGMEMAENVVLDREGIIESRRGFKRYGDQLDFGASVVTEFQRQLVVVDGTMLKYDPDDLGSWTTWAGAFNAPDGDHRIKFAQALSALFFTTSAGVYRNDALTNDPKLAGMPYGLDITPTLTGTGGGPIVGDSQVAYKSYFVRVDANMKEIRGAGSPRNTLVNPVTTLIAWTRAVAVITFAHTAHGFSNGDEIVVSASSDVAALPNGSYIITFIGANSYSVTGINAGAASGTATIGKDFDVSLDITIPTGVEAGDFLEVYRTELSADATVDPGDRVFRIIRRELDAGDITAGTITLSDTFDESFLGIDSYENDNAETVLQANYQPPFAKDLALYKGVMHYADTSQPHFLVVQLQDITGLTDGADTITITGQTYTFDTAETIATGHFKRFTSFSTLADNVEATARSLCRVINRRASNAIYFARYVSGPDDEPGRVLFTKRLVNTVGFALTANSAGTGDNFSPNLPTSGTSIASTDDAGKNRLYFSKFEQPDAVPIVNFDPVGSEFEPILRIVASRDSLFILKTEGVWLKSGDTIRDMTIRSLSPESKIVAPECAVVLDNAVWCLSTEGLLKISESGVEVASRPIENDLLQLLQFSNVRTLSFAIAYQSDRKFLMGCQTNSSDSKVTRLFTNNYFTKGWTTWLKEVQAGWVRLIDDRLYLSHASDRYILQERKSRSGALDDYMDEDIPADITFIDTTLNSDGDLVSLVTLDYNYATPIAPGFILSQGSDSAYVEAVTFNGSGSFTLELDVEMPDLLLGNCTISLAIPVSLRWNPETANNAAQQKHFVSVQVYQENDLAFKTRLGFATNLVPDVQYTDLIETMRSVGWGFNWGTDWGNDHRGGASPLRSFVPTQHRRASGLVLLYQHARAKEKTAITQVSFTYRGVSDRTRRTP